MDPLGYIKLSGEGVKKGRIDIGDATSFLSGIDGALHFFIVKDDPEFLRLDFKLDVNIQSGSIIVNVLEIGIATVATSYLSAAATQLAKNDIGDKDTSALLSGALRKMKSTVKIAKHLGGMDKKKPEGVHFEKENSILAIPNSEGEVLRVKREDFETFFSAPKDLYEPLVKPVNSDTELSIAVREDSGNFSEEKIKDSERPYFTGGTGDQEDSGLILPELVDGEFVELEGELTRGNGRTNTLGLAYQGHIITCTLEDGKVKDHKNALFGKVRITGTVTRHYESTVSEEDKKRPKLILRSVESLETQNNSSQVNLL